MAGARGPKQYPNGGTYIRFGGQPVAVTWPGCKVHTACLMNSLTKNEGGITVSSQESSTEGAN